MNKKYKSDFLFTTPSFIEGIGSVLNIGGNYFVFNYSESNEEADAKAIEGDWGIVGQDIMEVVKKNPIEIDKSISK